MSWLCPPQFLYTQSPRAATSQVQAKKGLLVQWFVDRWVQRWSRGLRQEDGILVMCFLFTSTQVIYQIFQVTVFLNQSTRTVFTCMGHRGAQTVGPGWYFPDWLRWYVPLILKSPFSLCLSPPPLYSHDSSYPRVREITKHNQLPGCCRCIDSLWNNQREP